MNRFLEWLQRPLVIDALIAVGVLVALLSEGRGELLLVFFIVWQSAPYVVRRRHPRLAHVLITAGLCGQVAAQVMGPATALSYVLVVYSAAKYAPSVWAKRVTPVVAVVVAVVVLLVHSLSIQLLVLGSLTNMGLYAIAWGLGLTNRRARNLTELLQAQQQAIVAEAETRVALAKHAERVQIAREMHDVVAHSLAVVVVQAEGAKYAAENTETWTATQHENTMALLHETVQQAQQNTDQLVDVLRDSAHSEHVPVTELAEVEQHVTTARRSGWLVDYRFEDPENCSGAVPVPVVRAAYRIVGEGVTNVLKHTPLGTRIEIVLGVSAAAVVIKVADDACPTGELVPGNGIAGMTERAEALGGTLTAQVANDGRFTVHARLPLTT